MRIQIITPAAVKSLSGNRATAQRWAGFLRALGHDVHIAVEWDQQECDLMIALHAWRSAASIQQFRHLFPDKALWVALTGTDLYRFIDTHPEPTLKSITLADRLLVLHDLAYLALPAPQRHKIQVVYQSAKPLNSLLKPSVDTFDICVVGHLRDEKDPFRAAYAVRNLPAESTIRVRHYGKAYSPVWAEKAQQEMAVNSRYQWFGEVSQDQIRQAYATNHLMVLSSKMEGGANVVSEACVAELPIIASNIDGSVGLLGEDYPGFYPVQNTQALRDLLLKAEAEAAFMAQLKAVVKQRAKQFVERMEQDTLDQLIQLISSD